jgi:hypothetical protein
MTADDLAFRIARSGAPAIDPNDAATAVEALSALGYEFVPPGIEGRFVETDEDGRSMAEYLRQNTSLSWQTAHGILREIRRLGLRIREPDTHPSGLRTQARAYETVVPFGAATIAAQKPIDRRGPGSWRKHE